MRFFTIIFLLVLGLAGEGVAYYPSTLWSSNRIPHNLIGIRAGKVTGDSGMDIVTVSSNRLYIFRLVENQLMQVFEHQGKSREEWIKFSLFDVDNDGFDEMIVTGFDHGVLNTVVASGREKKWRKIEEVPYYIYPIYWEDKKILVSQKRLGGDDFTGPIYEMTWDGKKLVKEREILMPAGLSVESISLYSVAGIKTPDQKAGFLELNSVGKLVHYLQEAVGKFRKTWTSGDSYTDSVVYLDIPITNMMNQVENRRFFVPATFQLGTSPRPLFEPLPPTFVEPLPPLPEQVVSPLLPPPPPEPPAPPPLQIYLIRNFGYLKNVIGAVPSVKNTQMVRLTYTGYGFQEDWNSPRLDGAISDFDLVDWDGDGNNEIVATFLLRDKGYVDTLKKQDSLVIVLDLPQ